MEGLGDWRAVLSKTRNLIIHFIHKTEVPQLLYNFVQSSIETRKLFVLPEDLSLFVTKYSQLRERDREHKEKSLGTEK